MEEINSNNRIEVFRKVASEKIEEINFTITKELNSDRCAIDIGPVDYYYDLFSVKYIRSKIWDFLVKEVSLEDICADDFVGTIINTIRESNRYKAIKLDRFLNG